MEEITRLANLPVYTREGRFVGNVKNLVLDLQHRRIDGLLIGRTNPNLVEEGRDVSIPYRWVQSFDDILLLRHFPERIGPAVPQTEGAPDTPPTETTFEAVDTPPTPQTRRVATRRA
ncbi:MAG TPA: PRC-barrel domain-containing protein [Candidatus Thermoplasmatota archaeon]|nr:PRC-barrel domain-containing protein [Candidatus Thermoplasmatota archaeon]